VPFIGHFALKDEWCTVQKVKDLENKLHKAGFKDFTIYFYDVLLSLSLCPSVFVSVSLLL
jgi:hypothetical protein